MIYQGSKRRIAKHIIPIMLAERKSDQWWVEPFVGGGNVIDKIEGKRIGSDINSHTIQALIHIRDNIESLPKNNKEFTINNYLECKSGGSYLYKDYIGYILGFNGIWMLGKGRIDRSGKRDYIKEAYDNALKQSSKLQEVILTYSDYSKLELPPNSLIYCDPPYKNCRWDKGFGKNFNHEEFWQWCRDKIDVGHNVFISEFSAPDDFKCIWKKEIKNNISAYNNIRKEKYIEKLFTHKGNV